MELKKYKLGEIATFINGRAYAQPELLEKGKYRVLRVGNIFDGNHWYYSDLELDKNKYCNDGDLLYSWACTFGPYIWHGEKTIFHYHIWKIEVNDSLVDKTFLYYFLQCQTKSFMGSTHGSTMIHITKENMENFQVSIPSLSNQKKIASVLSAIDKKIALNRAINQNLEALAKQLYDYWFVQFDFPNEEGKPYKSSGGKMVWNEKLKREIPEGWEVKPLKEICTVKDGTHDSPKPQNEGLPLITSKHLLPSGLDFKNAYLISKEDFEAINKRSKVEQYDILFSMIGTIGNMYFVDEKQINFAIKNMALIKTSEIEGLMYYILYNLGAVDYIRYENNALSGSIQKFLSLDAMRNIPVLYNESILSLYNEKVRHYQELYNSNNEENKQLTKQRDELLPLLMNGQVTIE